jgi:hypothetical protein
MLSCGAGRLPLGLAVSASEPIRIVPRGVLIGAQRNRGDPINPDDTTQPAAVGVWAALVIPATRAASRDAMSTPARQPGARPRGGGVISPASIPARTSSHEITAFEFHISPVCRWSRPQTRGGRLGTRSRICDAWARLLATRTGLETAAARSGITPSRQRRISYRKCRKRPASLVPTGPSKTTPRRSP